MNYNIITIGFDCSSALRNLNLRNLNLRDFALLNHTHRNYKFLALFFLCFHTIFTYRYRKFYYM